MTRGEALTALLAAVEAGESNWPTEINLALGNHIIDRASAAFHGSVDAVIRLEAPLRQRGWLLVVEGAGTDDFFAELAPPDGGRKVSGRASSEGPARLIALIRALLRDEAAA